MEQKKNKLLLLGLGVVAVGTGGYFFFKHLEAKKSSIHSTDFNQNTFIPETITSNTSSKSKVSSNGFPLKRGSKGILVKQIQQALINKYGNSILPQFGADGDFGLETQRALQLKNLPTSISPEGYTFILKSLGSKATQKLVPNNLTAIKTIAKGLHAGIIRDDFQLALTALKKIESIRTYSSVSTLFKLVRINGVRKSIVNALLTKFNHPNEKKQLNAQFSKIGLQYNGQKWSLNGVNSIIGQSQVISTHPCKVWNSYGESVQVDKDTILGAFLSTGNGITEFSTIDDQILFTKTSCIAFI